MTPEEKKERKKEQSKRACAKYYQRMKLNPEWVAKQNARTRANYKATAAKSPEASREQYRKKMERLKADPEAMERHRARNRAVWHRSKAKQRRAEGRKEPKARAAPVPRAPKFKPIKEIYVAPVVKSEPMSTEAAEIRTARQMRNSGERWSVVADYLGVSVEAAKLKLEAA